MGEWAGPPALQIRAFVCSSLLPLGRKGRRFPAIWSVTTLMRDLLLLTLPLRDALSRRRPHSAIRGTRGKAEVPRRRVRVCRKDGCGCKSRSVAAAALSDTAPDHGHNSWLFCKAAERLGSRALIYGPRDVPALRVRVLRWHF